MQNNFFTDDQKLDYVFQIIKEQEARRKSAFWWGIIRRIIIYGAIILVYLNYTVIITKIIEIMKPMIMEQASSIIDGNKDALLKKMKDTLNNP